MSLAPLDKCTVTGSVLKPDGTPVYPGTVTFTLSRRDRDGDITIMPVAVEVDTDTDGNISAELWPNVDGQAGTVYTAVVQFGKRGTPRTSYPAFKVVVPDEATANLADISELVPPPTVDDATAQVLLAVAAKNEAVAAKVEAKGYRDDAQTAATATAADVVATAANRTQTGEDKTATAADRVATGEDRTAAAGSADAAATSEGNAAGSAGDAAGFASTAAGKASDADDAATASAGSASTATAQAVLSAAWAEGTEPGGAGTKSAKEWAQAAAASAATEANGVAIYHETQIDLGGYIADIGARVDSVQTDLLATLVGDAGSEMDFYLSIDGALSYGPVTVTAGEPLHLTGLSIAVAKAQEIDVVATYQSGPASDLIVKTIGASA